MFPLAKPRFFLSIIAFIELVKYIFDPPQPPLKRGEPENNQSPPFQGGFRGIVRDVPHRFNNCYILGLFSLIFVSCSPVKLDSEPVKISDRPLENVTATNQSQATMISEEKPIKIMPLGDSITDGYNYPGGYRINLWKQLSDRGYKINFVGSLINGPNYLPDREHEGHSGWRIDQINEYINIWLKRTKPDVILLTIGTNDIAQNYRVQTAPKRLNNLIDDIFQEVPNADILVASIPPIEMEEVNRKVKEYNRAIAALIERRQKEGDRLVFVDINSALDFDDLEDTVHPNGRGHSKMANLWEEALIPLFENR